MEKATENTPLLSLPSRPTPKLTQRWYVKLAVLISVKLALAILFLNLFPYLNSIDKSYGSTFSNLYGCLGLAGFTWMLSMALRSEGLPTADVMVASPGTGDMSGQWNEKLSNWDDDSEDEDDDYTPESGEDSDSESSDDSENGEDWVISEDEALDLLST